MFFTLFTFFNFFAETFFLHLCDVQAYCCLSPLLGPHTSAQPAIFINDTGVGHLPLDMSPRTFPPFGDTLDVSPSRFLRYSDVSPLSYIPGDMSRGNVLRLTDPRGNVRRPLIEAFSYLCFMSDV